MEEKKEEKKEPEYLRRDENLRTNLPQREWDKGKKGQFVSLYHPL